MAKIDYKFFKRCPKRGVIVGINKKSIWFRLLFPILGLAALIWFLIRVIPKPSRAAYPCQQVAAPMAVTFLASFGAGAGILLIGRNIVSYLREQWLSTVQIASIGLSLTILLATSCPIDYTNTSTTGTTIPVSSTTSTVDGITSPSQEEGNANMGNFIAQTAADPDSLTVQTYGTEYSKVIWARNPKAARWDLSGVWWSDNFINHADVNLMFSESLQQMTGEDNDSDAWDTIFKNYQVKNGLPQEGYEPDQTIAIKLNMNGVDVNGYIGQGVFVSPPMVYTLARQLVDNAGIPADKITFYDVTRNIPDIIYNKIKHDPDLAGIKFVAFAGGSGRIAAEADLDAQVQWSGDYETDTSMGRNRGQAAYLPTVVTDATYLINFSNLKGHDLAGFTATAKNWFGSIMSGGEKWAPDLAGIHPTVAAREYDAGNYAYYSKRAIGTYNAIVDLMAHPDLGGKTILYILDALYAIKFQNGSMSAAAKWQQTEFQKDGQPWWPSSLLMSQDGVAIDSVGYDMLKDEPSITTDGYLPAGHTADNYLIEAANAGTTTTPYIPTGSGDRAPNLGNRVSWP